MGGCSNILGSDSPMIQNKMDTSIFPGGPDSFSSRPVHRWAEQRMGKYQELTWAPSWHRGAEPSACQDRSISDPCSGSPVFPPQMDSLQKGVSPVWLQAALQGLQGLSIIKARTAKEMNLLCTMYTTFQSRGQCNCCY